MATLPNPNPISNNAFVLYNFVLNNTPPVTINTAAISNSAITTVNQADLTLSKSVSPLSATLGNTLTYTMVINNTGNVAALNTVLLDTIPTATTFVANSVTVNGATQPGANPGSGFTVSSSIAAGALVTVMFQVTITTLPSSNSIVNYSNITYSYKIDPNSATLTTGSANAGPANTSVTVGNLLVTKSADKVAVAVNKNLRYTISMTNSGNVTLTNVRLIDTIPQACSFVSNSLTINGVSQPDNPTVVNGASIGQIQPGGVVNAIFDVRVNTLPATNPVSNNAMITFNFTSNPANPNAERGSAVTNSITTTINFAELTLTKTADKSGVAVGQDIRYIIAVRNSGNVAANSVTLRDTIPQGTTFTANSVTIDNVSQVGANPSPPTGINLGTINALSTKTVTFLVNVSTMPATNPIPNSATATFTFTGDPSVPNGETGGSNSNNLQTPVSQINIAVTKSVDRLGATVGNTLNYSIAIRNTSAVTANSVIIVDTIPRGTTFNSGSLLRDGASITGSPAPPNGINIGTVNPNTTSTISFIVTVVSIPNPNSAINAAHVGFRYTVDPNTPNGESGFLTTNDVTTNLGTCSINSTKTVDKAGATLNEQLTYTIALTNTGNLEAHLVTLRDTIPQGTTFNTGSLRINGVTVSGANPAPPNGILVGTIPGGTTVTVTFKVTVVSIPTGGSINNSSTTTFVFTQDPSNVNGATGSSNSAVVSTNIGVVNLVMTKSADKTGVALNDIIEYTIGLNNTGNTSATNILLLDTIPLGTTLVQDSVRINGTQMSGASPAPPTGLMVSDILPLGTSTITFRVNVVSIPSTNSIINNSTARFNYIVDPAVTSGVIGYSNSNTITIPLNQATLVVVKSRDKGGASLNERIKYTIALRNSGNTNANNVWFSDTIPEGTNFVPNSVTIDGIVQSGATPAPGTGINLGSISAFSAKTITFQVEVITIGNSTSVSNFGSVSYNYSSTGSATNDKTMGLDTNTVSTSLGQAIVNMSKSSDKQGVKIGDVITYFLTVANTGNLQANQIRVIDTIPQGTTIVTNSVRVNGAQQIGASPAPPSGFVLTVPANSVSTVSFQVDVVTIPANNTIVNFASASYRFTSDPSIPNGAGGGTNTNTVTIPIARSALTAVKTAERGVAVGESIHYQIVISNSGNVDANNVVLVDTLPTSTMFNSTSVAVNNVPQPLANPATGINVGSILAGAVATVEFNVTTITIPSTTPISNVAYVGFSYTVDPSVPNGARGSITSNSSSTNIGLATITANKTCDKRGAQIGEIVTYSIALRNNGNTTANAVTVIDTIPDGLSFVPNSIKVNGATQTGAVISPPTGFMLGVISANIVKTVTFQATVDTIPMPNPIDNNASISFTFTVDPSLPNNKQGEANTNSVSLSVANVNLRATKAANKPGATVGDIVQYAVGINNPGNSIATNVTFIDTIPSGAAFVPNSVMLNGTQQPGRTPSPPAGIPVGNIGPGTTTTITFEITVETVPTNQRISNSGTVTYKYTIDPSLPNGAFGSSVTNVVTTPIALAKLNIIKSSNKVAATLGEIVTYSLRVNNTGNILAEDVMLSDTTPDGMVFVASSVIIDGVGQPGTILDSPGLMLGNIASGGQKLISYDVRVDTVPQINPTPNSATAQYMFSADPSLPAGSSSNSDNSNIVNLKICSVEITANKTVDKSGAKIGDILTYTLEIINSGNVDVGNAVLIDTIPLGLTYVYNSLTIDGIVKPSVNPNPPNGVDLGTIPAEDSITVIFKVKVESIPSPNPVNNIATLRYNYLIAPSVPIRTGGLNTTGSATTGIGVATIILTKAVDKVNARPKENIQYTFVLRNTGNQQANEVTLFDAIPVGSNYIENSFTVNDMPQLGVNPAPPTGVNIGNIQPGETSTVTFNITTISIPVVNPLVNKGNVTFKYTVDPENPNEGEGSSTSNTVSTNIKEAIIDFQRGLTKTVNKTFADINEELLYSITLKNTGNVAAENIVLVDTVPNGAELIDNSIRINGIVQSGATASSLTMLSLGNLGSNQSMVVDFKLIAISIPNVNPLQNTASISFTYSIESGVNPIQSGGNSNTVSTTIRHAEISQRLGGLMLSADSQIVTADDILNYFVEMRNQGNVPAVNVKFMDTIPNETTYNSSYGVYVNGQFSMGTSVLPPAGVFIGTINPQESTTLNFQVKVKNLALISSIVNTGIVDYNYIVDPSIPTIKSQRSLTNTVITQYGVAILSLTKSANKKIVGLSEEVTYSILVENEGNTDATDVIILDTVPKSSEFIVGSVFVDQINRPSEAPETGIFIGTARVGSAVTVTYSVRVNDIMRGKNDLLINTARVEYRYST